MIQIVENVHNVDLKNASDISQTKYSEHILNTAFVIIVIVVIIIISSIIIIIIIIIVILIIIIPKVQFGGSGDGWHILCEIIVDYVHCNIYM